MVSPLKTWQILAVLGVILVGLAAYLCRDSLNRFGLPPDERPTYILIVLDDLDWDLVVNDWATERTGAPRFPEMHGLARSGMVFSNFHATTPVCGPARASILSGQYAHRHQARVNRPDHPTAHGFSGGYANYGRNRDFARYFQAGGYQTCFVGKYVHDGFSPNRAAGTTWADVIPNGWDRFHACLGAKYVDFLAMDSATNLTHSVPTKFRVDYEADQVLAMLAEKTEARKPQMVCWFSLSPHDSEDQKPAYPERLQTAFADENPPSFARGNTGALGLKLPTALRALPDQLTAAQRAMIVEKWRERLRSIKAFDENLARVRAYLAQEDRLKNTVFVITSDHGYRLGDHGHVGKRLPYDRITCVPLLISGAGVAAGRNHSLLANIDMAPTLIDLALGPQAVQFKEFDGKSFAPLVLQPNIAPFQREEILIECWEAENVWGERIPGVWTVLRGENFSYTEWATGDREYYQLDVDLEQLDNRIDTLTAEQAANFRQRLLKLRDSRERPPTVTVQTDLWQRVASSPQNLTYVPISIFGFADAEAGVESVTLEMHDTDKNQYWNGRDWQAETAQITAELKNAGGLVSQWNCSLRMPLHASQESVSSKASEFAERKISVTVRAIGKNGSVQSMNLKQGLQLRPMDPETWIQVADKPETVGSGVRLAGQAIGTKPIRNVRVVVQNKQDKKYWNGEAWVETYTHFEATLQPTENGGVAWSFTYLGELQDRLHFGARALDEKSDFDKTPAYFEWGASGGEAIEYSNNSLPSGTSFRFSNL